MRSDRRRASPRRRLFSSFVIAAVLVAGAYGWQAARSAGSAQNEFTIAMSDYAFSPDHMVWRVGDRVTIRLVDDSQAHPPKEHEFMVGRVPRTEQTVFGVAQEDGFETPFFSGVTIEIKSGSGLKMLMAGDAKLTGIAPKDVMAQGPMGPMEEMTGFMPLLAGSSDLTFSFIVPDRPGEWTFGCFQQSGQHFLNGMKGTIQIVEKSA